MYHFFLENHFRRYESMMFPCAILMVLLINLVILLFCLFFFLAEENKNSKPEGSSRTPPPIGGMPANPFDFSSMTELLNVCL